MARMPEFNMGKIMKDVKCKAVVRVSKGFRLRLWIFKVLVVLAVRILGARPEVRIDVDSDS